MLTQGSLTPTMVPRWTWGSAGEMERAPESTLVGPREGLAEPLGQDTALALLASYLQQDFPSLGENNSYCTGGCGTDKVMNLKELRKIVTYSSREASPSAVEGPPPFSRSHRAISSLWASPATRRARAPSCGGQGADL